MVQNKRLKYLTSVVIKKVGTINKHIKKDKGLIIIYFILY